MLGFLYLVLCFWCYRGALDQVQSTKYEVLSLGGFVVDLVRDSAQDQRYFRITHLRRFKTNLDIEIPVR